MNRAIVLAAAAALALAACAGPQAGRRSYTPPTEVVVKGGERRPAQADYRTSPEQSMRTGSGGSEQ